MTSHCANVRILVPVVLLAGAMLAASTGCSVTLSDQADSVAPPDQADLVITAEVTAQLGPDHHLILDLRLGGYRIDTSAGPVDLTYVDVVDPTGRVDPIERLVTTVVNAGDVARESLERGFSVTASGGQVLVSALAINGLELVEATSSSSSTWWRSPEVYCSGNNKLIGMGSSQLANGNILYRGLIPIQGNALYPVGAEVAAQEDLAGTTANWTMTAYAICGVQPSSLTVADSGSPYSSAATRTWTASCPGGTKVIGAGGTIWQGDGRVKIDEIRPNETLDQVTVVASEDQDGTTASWSLRAYAVCAVAPPGLVRVKTVASNGWDGRSVVARCPSEKRLLGVGGGVSADDMRALRIFDIIPSWDLTSATVRVTTKGSTSGVTGEVRSYAICADG